MVVATNPLSVIGLTLAMTWPLLGSTEIRRPDSQSLAMITPWVR
jgi:hypothetical protein